MSSFHVKHERPNILDAGKDARKTDSCEKRSNKNVSDQSPQFAAAMNARREELLLALKDVMRSGQRTHIKTLVDSKLSSFDSGLAAATRHISAPICKRYILKWICLVTHTTRECKAKGGRPSFPCPHCGDASQGGTADHWPDECHPQTLTETLRSNFNLL